MLIKCPECGKEVSDSAANCVHCGYPLNHKKEEIPKEEKVEKNGGLVVTTNVILGIFGLLLSYAVIRSNGGAKGNGNAAAVSWFIEMGSIFAVFAIKKLNKVAAVIFAILFSGAMLISLQSAKIAPVYLVLEFILAINGLLTLRYLKKNKVL